MKTILCYGDSNTWGYDAAASINSPVPVRHAPSIRWTGKLTTLLGSQYRVIEEGQNGRTTVHEDPMAEASRNGRTHLPVVLETHAPIDLVILMLGTNDLKTMLALPPQDIAGGVATLTKMILRSPSGPAGKAPQVLLVCPAAVGEMLDLPDLGARFEQGREKSLQLPRHYESVAQLLEVQFLNAQDFVEPTPIDALHLDAENHEKLAAGLALAVRRIFGEY
jgi:lysophospholipase L1-like esterase